MIFYRFLMDLESYFLDERDRQILTVTLVKEFFSKCIKNRKKVNFDSETSIF